jgi:hypothetical protein
LGKLDGYQTFTVKPQIAPISPPFAFTSSIQFLWAQLLRLWENLVFKYSTVIVASWQGFELLEVV